VKEKVPQKGNDSFFFERKNQQGIFQIREGVTGHVGGVREFRAKGKKRGRERENPQEVGFPFPQGKGARG